MAAMHYSNVILLVYILQMVANPYSSGGGDMKQYHHANCLFETFVRARPTTRVILEPDDVHGYDDLTEEDQAVINKLIDGRFILRT
jgi:DNA ligase-3